MATHSFHRTDRLSAQLRRDLGVLVQSLVRQQQLPWSSVVDVEVTRDLRHAKVFVSVLVAARADDVMTVLRAQTRALRMQLARQVRLRHVPELHFVYDDSAQRAQRIDALLNANRPPPDPEQ